MSFFASVKLPGRALFAVLALLGASAALADNASDLDARAAAEYNRGLDARDAGQNESACEHFRNAAVLYENSINALMSRSMQTEEDREYIKTAANQQQTQVDKAKSQAKEVCGRP
jgi:hypothetical protein